jgi:hypothetical protein
LAQLQLKAESYAKEVLYGKQSSGSAFPALEDPLDISPMNIIIDPASTYSGTEEGDAGAEEEKTGEV